MDADRIAQRAFDLHEGCQMPLDQALALALKEANGPIWPIAKLVVRDGEIASATLYTPGLPDGEHDVFPLPVDSAALPTDVPDLERADQLADESMFELLMSYAIGGNDGCYCFPAADDYGHAEAKEAFDWLRPRGYVKLDTDEHGEFIRVIREPGSALPDGVPANSEASSTTSQQGNGGGNG